MKELRKSVLTNQEGAEVAMFGETIAEMRNAVIFTNLNDPVDVIGYAAAILSDAQETLAWSAGEKEVEKNRQLINKTKYFLEEAKRLVRGKE